MIKTLKRWLGFGGATVAYTGGNTHYARGLFQTVAGAVINEQTALTIPAFFHALRLYGQTIGSLEWNLVQHDADRRKSVARAHPVHRLIHDEPNEFQLPSAFRETIIGHAIAYGNGYAFIERNGNFRPTALMPLMPYATWPERHAGQLVYVTIVNGQQQRLQPWQVFHIAGFSTNGLTGVPLVQLMKETLGLTKAEEQFAASYFGNGANYGGVVEVPGRLSDAAMKNLKQQVADNAGLGNAFKWLFLEEGMKATQSQSNADKAQLVESRQFQLGDLARITGLAPHLLFDLSRSTNNNIEHQGIEAVTYSFRPWANKLTQEANRKLLYESEKGVYETVIDMKPLMQGDAKTQAERDQIRFNTAALTPNEIRERDGLNPIEGGDQLFLNLAVVPLNLAVAKAQAEVDALEAALNDPEEKTEIEKAEEEGIDADPQGTNDDAPPQGDKTFDDGPKVDTEEIEDAAGLGGPTRAALRGGPGSGPHPGNGKKEKEKGGKGDKKTREPSKSAKSILAKQSATYVGKDIQRYAEEHNEPKFAEHVGGASFKDNQPVDVVTGGDVKPSMNHEDAKLSGVKAEHGVELKTMVSNKAGKITMDKYAQVRKVNWESESGATFHTVVIDDRNVYNAKGEGKHDESKREIYYRRGIAGSARIDSLHKCEGGMDEVKKLMATPDAKLPAAAQRTDGPLRNGKWKVQKDGSFKNTKTGEIVKKKK